MSRDDSIQYPSTLATYHGKVVSTFLIEAIKRIRKALIMTLLNLVLSPESVAKLHDILVCLSKFSESVSIEAQRDHLSLSSLNSSKSAYASFALAKGTFFTKYQFIPTQIRPSHGSQVEPATFTCRIYNKALLSVFKGRLLELREKETAIERCELLIQDSPEKTECRLIVKMICRHGKEDLKLQWKTADSTALVLIPGVIKTYKLTYESIEVMRAIFNKESATNRWKISSKVLKESIEHFSPRTEQLDMYSENGRATFTSYVEKLMDGKEVLKQPLQTSVTMETTEFQEFAVEEKLHIAISVKDFKAIVLHAETLNASITVLFSHPTRPMQLAYDIDGVSSEFTLMTIGDYRAISVTPSPAPHTIEPRSETQPAEIAAQRTVGLHTNEMAPMRKAVERNVRPLAAKQREKRSSPPRTTARVESDSLFFPDDDDRRWDENVDNEEGEDVLGWDPSADLALAERPNRSFGDHRTAPRSERPSRIERDSEPRIEPTQRISQIHGIFDD